MRIPTTPRRAFGNFRQFFVSGAPPLLRRETRQLDKGRLRRSTLERDGKF